MLPIVLIESALADASLSLYTGVLCLLLLAHLAASVIAGKVGEAPSARSDARHLQWAQAAADRLQRKLSRHWKMLVGMAALRLTGLLDAHFGVFLWTVYAALVDD